MNLNYVFVVSGVLLLCALALGSESNETSTEKSGVAKATRKPRTTNRKMPREKDVKPRGRMTAYAFFVQVCREEHKKKHPEETVVFAEFSKKCAERWKTMSEKEKKRFQEMADKDKKRYDSEMSNYIPPAGEKVRGKRRKQIKDPNAPKRSLSAFFWFCNDERGKIKQDNPEFGVGDIAKQLGKKWADVDPSIKQKYEQMAEKDKARYEKEMTAYKNQAAMPVQEEVDDDDDDTKLIKLLEGKGQWPSLNSTNVHEITKKRRLQTKEKSTCSIIVGNVTKIVEYPLIETIAGENTTKKIYTRKSTPRASRNFSTLAAKTTKFVFRTTTVTETMSTFVPTARFYLGPYHKHIEDMFNTFGVLLFTNSDCDKSEMARAAFAKCNFTNYEEKVVNQRGDANAILDTLLVLTGTRSVPKCWIRGVYVGNHRRLSRLADTGELQRLLEGLDKFTVYYPVSFTEKFTTTTVVESLFYYDDQALAIREKLKQTKNLTDSQINEIYGG